MSNEELQNKIESVQQKLEEINKEFEAKRKALSIVVFDELKNLFAYGAEKFPKLVKAFVWSQYTPYFNDGDACEFGVGDLYINYSEVNSNSWDIEVPQEIKGNWPAEGAYQNAMFFNLVQSSGGENKVLAEDVISDKDEYWDNQLYLHKVQLDLIEDLNTFEAYKQYNDGVHKLFRSIPEDIMKAAFGEHAFVVVGFAEDGNVVVLHEEYLDHD